MISISYSCFLIYFVCNFWCALGVDSGDTICVSKAGNSGGRETHPGNLIITLKAKTTDFF